MEIVSLIINDIPGVAIVLYLLFYFPKELANELSLRQMLRKIDYGGAFLVTAGLVLFILGIQMGGNTYPWKSSKVLGQIVTGGLVLIGFVLYGRSQNCPRLVLFREQD